MKGNLTILPLQSSTLLIESYSENHWNYLQNECLKYDLIKSRCNRQKQGQAFFQLHWKPHLTLNIKLQMLLQGLKWKQLEENTIYIIQRELQINIHKVDNGLNEAAIRDN